MMSHLGCMGLLIDPAPSRASFHHIVAEKARAALTAAVLDANLGALPTHAVRIPSAPVLAGKYS